jgi:chromosome segregation ATPase
MQLQREQSLILGKEHEISKLRRNLETAVQAATSEKLMLAKTKEEVMSHTHQLQYLKDKLAAAEREIANEKQKRVQERGQTEELENSLEVLRTANRELEICLNLKRE